VSDVYAPISGKVTTVNDRLTSNPEIINEDPYGEGWMVKVELTDAAEVDGLMTAAQYRDFVAQEKA
jgi:glycine cleavage system H protein